MKQIPQLLLTISLILIAINCQAQNPILDSLKALVKSEKADTNKVNTLNELSWENTNIGDYDQALKNANDAILIAQQLGYEIGLADSYSRIGRVHESQGNFPEALKNYYAAIKIKQKLGNKQAVANSYINIANIYFRQSNYPEALKNYNASLKINQELNNKTGIASSHNGLGTTYQTQGNYPEALQNLFASLKINEALGNRPGVASSYNNIGLLYDDQKNYSEAIKNFLAAIKINQEIGNMWELANVYNNIGVVYHSQGKYPEAIENYSAALKIKEELGNKAGIASTYTNIGNVYGKQHNFAEALKNYFAALKISEEIGSKDVALTSYANIGMVNGQLKKYDAASIYIKKALALSKEIGNKNAIKGSYLALSDINNSTGNWREAYENHKMYILYRDSLFNEENTKKTVQTAMNYEFDKKEQAAKLVQEKKDALAQQEVQKQAMIRNLFVGGFAIVLLFSIVFFWQRNKVRKEKERSEELLLNILPAEVAEELKVKGSADAKLISEVTVLFTDFKGFTQYSEKLTPQKLVEDIHECFSAFDNIMEKHGMEKIKTIGDAYMAAGGLPSPNTTHATDAVNAAFEIAHFIDEMKARKITQGVPFFEIRIGIHTGQVVAGIVGIKKYSYDIWGDTVNTASRMESSGEAGKVNISESTYELVKTQFRCVHRGKITAKSKGDIDMYFVEAV